MIYYFVIYHYKCYDLPVPKCTYCLSTTAYFVPKLLEQKVEILYI